MIEVWVVTLHDGNATFPVGVYTTKEKAFYYVGKDCANNDREVKAFFPQLDGSILCQVTPDCDYEIERFYVNKPMDY